MSAAAGSALRVPFGALALDYQQKRAAIDAAIARVLQRGWFVLGEEVAAFEAAFAKFLGVSHVVACANGTEAIALALRALGAGPEDEVVLPANTCGPTLAGVRMAGARAVLADVDENTLTLGAAQAEKVLTPATRVLLPVHLYGGLADLSGLVALANNNKNNKKLSLVEDCAQSHGALFEGRAAGAFGRTAAFSFYPTKNLGAYGDGGAVATNEPETADRLRQLRQYGWTRRDFAESEGWNSRLDELQAAILGAKLPSLASENARRLQIANRYDAAFSQLPLRLVGTRSGSVPARHLYTVRTEKREALRQHLSERGVETSVHYPVPLHLQPAYGFLGGKKGDFPVSEKACETIVSLPLYAALTDEQVEAVVGGVTSFFETKP
ncbi:MAG: DegT/DnrJ/EryC1/StrS family aminotransferase [Thermoanaerobaculia bacterium]